MSKNRINTEKRSNTTLALETISQAAKHGNDDELINALNLTASAFKQQYNANCLYLPFGPKSSRFQRITNIWNTTQAKIVNPKEREKNTFFFLSRQEQPPLEAKPETANTETAPATPARRKRKGKKQETATEATPALQAEAAPAEKPKRSRKHQGGRKQAKQTSPGTPLANTADYIAAVKPEELTGMALLLKEAAARRHSAAA